jgi:Calcineurin-like phosphoesterase
MDRPLGRTRRERGVARVLTTAVVVAITASTLIFAIPHAPAATQVHLTAAGDYGARASTATVLQKIADLHPDAHLALGDLAYGDVTSEPAWCNYVKARVGEGFPFELISGNHESLDEANGLINNYSACLPNQIPGVVGTYGREYYMDFPQGAPLVRVINASPMLTYEDGVWTYAQGDAHYNWLSNAIDDGRAKGAKWIIVTSHIPCLSVGIYNCPSAASAFYQLLAAKKVDLVLHGHEHGYMRTHQLRSGVSGCPTIPSGSFNQACVADSDNAYIAGQGSVFATVGTGGTPLRDVDPTDTEAGYFAAFEGLNLNPTYGLLDLSITDTQLTAQFVPTSGGTFSDSFTITKGTPPANQPGHVRGRGV